MLGWLAAGAAPGAPPVWAAPSVAVPRGLPSYAALTKQMPELWKQKFPIEALRFEPDEKREVIRATDREGAVYYYRYRVHLPRPVVKSGELEKKPGRIIEMWVRVRPGQKPPFDVTFVRRDLLPGRHPTVLIFRE